MNDTLENIIDQINKEKRACIARREMKIEQHDTIAMVGWDGKVQGLEMAIAIIRGSIKHITGKGTNRDAERGQG